jgi:hypothetical protein
LLSGAVMRSGFVIARSVATKQSSLLQASGLLRFARNDELDLT